MFYQRKSLTDATKSDAYLVYSEWGPQSRIPRPARLRELFPAVAEVDLQGWIAEFQEVQREIWRYAETGGPRLRPRDVFVAHMRNRFAFMNEAAMGRAWSLAVYYTVHEGY